MNFELLDLFDDKLEFFDELVLALCEDEPVMLGMLLREFEGSHTERGMLLVVVDLQQQLGHLFFRTCTGVPLVDDKLRHIQIRTFALRLSHASNSRLGRILKQLLQRLHEHHDTRKKLCQQTVGCRTGTRLVFTRLRFKGRPEPQGFSATSVSLGSAVSAVSSWPQQ